MSNVEESGIAFDFTAAHSLVKHDAQNQVWPAVDFLIEEAESWVWLEIKNWEPATLPEPHRETARQKFLEDITRQSYFRDLREKFFGTCTFLTLTGQPPTQKILYVVLIESPRFDPALKLQAMKRLQDAMPTQQKGTVWATIPFAVVVVDLAEWNRRFSEYPAKAQ